MNCATVRQQLLNSDSPERPNRVEADHLAHCADCSSWHTQLLRLELEIPRLVVAVPPVPEALLATIRSQPLPQEQLVVLADYAKSGHSRPEKMRRKLAFAASLAACLAVFTFTWWLWPPASPSNPTSGKKRPVLDPWQQRLAKASNAEQRAAVYIDFADELLLEMKHQGPNNQNLLGLVARFERVIAQELLRSANEVRSPSRKQTLGELADRLARAESEASFLASEWVNRETASAGMRRVALSAKEGERRLRQMLAQG
jgi:hypothetical protein